jgi:pimeloyl-ACP methyl ester carboxylesterase
VRLLLPGAAQVAPDAIRCDAMQCDSVMARIEVNGTRLEFIERGNGDPVVFVHGSASDHRTWHATLDDLSDRFRTIAYSRRYHWPNDRIAIGADYSMSEHVDDLAALLRSLDLGTVHLVGHSYGAFVALLLAIRAPQNVRSLVLAEPPVFTLFVSNEPKLLEILKLALTRPRTAAAVVKFGATGIAPATAAAERGDMDAAMRTFGTAVLGKEFYGRMSAARLAQVADNSIKAEFLGSGFSALADDQVRGVQTSTLLIGGQRSPPLFHRLLDRLQELLPHNERVGITDASHLVHEDNATDYNAAVRSFLVSH